VRGAGTGRAAPTANADRGGAAVPAKPLARRLGPRARPGTAARPTALGTHLRLLVACLPAGAAGYATAKAADGLGSYAAAGAGTIVLALVVVLLAGPLRLTEITDLVHSLRRKTGR
ncbi:murein biosynthesis integral membrane protein MurJ, partial [Streptomyces lavendulae]